MGTKNFSSANDLITFSRASGGTALRKVAYGPELVTNGTFDTDISGWTTQAGGSTFTVSSGQLTISRSAVDPGYVYQTISTTAGNVYYVTFGVIDNGPIDLRVGTSPAGLQITSSGIKSSAGTYTLAFVATGASTYISLVNTSYSTDATVDNVSVKEVLFDDASGDLTLLNHPADIPRIEYDADGNVLGLLVEESRTNLITYSEDFTNASWIASGSDVSGSAEGPDGVSNSATILVDDGGGGIISAYVRTNVTVATSTDYTASVFAKADQLGWIAVYARDFTTPANGQVFFDLNNGAVGAESAGISGQIEDFGNGWYRCSITFTTDAADTAGSIRIYPADADNDSIVDRDGTSSILIYGAQFEAGAFPTSYIPTAGATATRSADVAIISAAEIPLNVGAGTFVAEFDFVDPENNVNNYVAGGLSNARIIYNNTGNSLWQTYDGNAAITFGNLDNTGASFFKAAVGVKTGKDAVTFLDGTFKGSSASATDLMTNLAGTDIALGGASASQKLNGHIRSIKYYPRRLTNAQLEALTAPRSGETLFLTFDGLESSFTEKSIHG